MFGFSRKEVSLDMYNTLAGRVADLNGRLAALELEQEAFRNKILRKSSANSEEPKELNKSDGGLIKSPWVSPASSSVSQAKKKG